MQVFISSDRRHRFFIDVACEAVDQVNRSKVGEEIRPIYPPRLLGIDTGRMLADVLPILDADVVLLNVTPSKQKGRWIFNTGVMVEYGMTLGRTRATRDATLPKPYYRVFCNATYPRNRLPPLLNEERINSFTTSNTGRAALRERIASILRQALAERTQPTRESREGAEIVTRAKVTFQSPGEQAVEVPANVTIKTDSG